LRTSVEALEAKRVRKETSDEEQTGSKAKRGEREKSQIADGKPFSDEGSLQSMKERGTRSRSELGEPTKIRHRKSTKAAFGNSSDERRLCGIARRETRMKRFRKGERQSIRRLCVPSIQQCQSVVCRHIVLIVR